MDVMEARACPACGARNGHGSAYCWQCYARFSGPVPGAVPAPGAIPSEGGTSAIARATAPFAKLEAPARAAPPARWRAFVPWALIVLVAAAGWVAWQRVSAPGLPDELGGLARMEGPVAEQLEAVLEPIRQAYDAHVVAAAYGTGQAPTYTLFVIEKDEGGEQVASLTGLQGATRTIPLPEGVTFTAEPGSDVVCGSTEAQGNFGVVCMWDDPGSTGLLTGVNVDLTQARQALGEARAVL